MCGKQKRIYACSSQCVHKKEFCFHPGNTTHIILFSSIARFQFSCVGVKRISKRRTYWWKVWRHKMIDKSMPKKHDETQLFLLSIDIFTHSTNLDCFINDATNKAQLFIRKFHVSLEFNDKMSPMSSVNHLVYDLW